LGGAIEELCRGFYGGLQCGKPLGTMSCFSWNYHGSIVRELREFAKRFALTALRVLQTQIHKARVESLKSTLGYDNSFAISSAGRSGRLGVFWNNNIRVQILPYS
jgi:hypothetical protein